jgi:hypothetical protein
MTLTEQIEILKQARDGLHMWHMDTRGVDAMLAQHGVDVSALPQHEPMKSVTIQVNQAKAQVHAVQLQVAHAQAEAVKNGTPGVQMQAQMQVAQAKHDA